MLYLSEVGNWKLKSTTTTTTNNNNDDNNNNKISYNYLK